jgi:type VI secretion system secreted protein Hcp
MAVDIFLKIQSPDVSGESQDSVHKDQIDVIAWSWGLSNSGSAQSGGGAGSGKVNVQDLTITKYVDKASTGLILAACNGTHYATVTLYVRKAGGTAPIEYLVITLTEVIVTSVSTGGSGGQDRLTENVSLNFATVQVQYTPQKTDGSADAALTVGWNVLTNAKL